MYDKFPISRRSLMKASAALAVAGSGVLGARKASAADETRLKVALTPPATQTTLGFMTENEGTGPLQPMYEFLTMTDHVSGAVIPNLATEWQSSADTQEWRFTLRSDVTFHDGKPFTAKDVVKSWELLTAPDSRATSASVFRRLIASADRIKIVNDHEVIFELQAAEPELPYYLSQSQGFLIYSKDHWDSVGQAGYAAKPVGTGPFEFVEFRQGQYILFKRVENHWRKTPEFAELQFHYMPEETTRLAALLAGEVHIAEISRSLQTQALARGKKIVTSSRPAASISARFGGNYLTPKGPPGPLTDKLVRQAMNLAVNRDEINAQIFGGRGTAAVVEGFQSTDAEFDPAWEPYPYDPEKAKSLLAEAGYGDGFEFDMSVVSPAGFPELPTVVEALSIYYSNIGLRPNLVEMEFAEQNNRQRAANFYNTVYTGRNSIRPLFRVIEYFSSKGIYHFFEDPYIEERIASFGESVDPEKRSALLREIGDFVYKAYATIPLLYLYAEVAVDPEVVAEYKADMGAFGASIGHEYTKAA
ncbi:ABC transporter substrate-binding protein [Pseudochelatococcus sp. B33]